MGLIFKSKKERKEDKELIEYLDDYEKLEKQVDSESDKFNLLNLLDKDPNEEELKKYMTQEQIEDEERSKKVNKNLTIISVSVFVVIMAIAITIIFVINYHAQDDLHKIYMKELKNYYNNKYNSRVSIEDIQYLCFTNADRQKECTDIMYAHTSDNHIIIKKNDEIGDNNSTASLYKSYKEDLLNYVTADKLIYNSPKLSYTNFYYAYYQYVDYIDVLPNKSYEEIHSNKTLTVRDFIIYQGDIDNNSIYEYIKTFSDDSEFILLKTNKGMPVNLKVVNNRGLYSIDILNQSNLDDNIIYYQLDSNYNNTSAVNLSKVSTTSIKPLVEGSTFSDTYSFKIDKHRSSYNDDINRDVLPSFYLISINNKDNFNMIQFSGTSELAKENYKYMYYIGFSNKTYILATSDISIGNITYNNKKK